MKKITLALVMITIAISILAQAPQAFKYQAVVRDNAGEILQNQAVGVRISIHQGSALGEILYQETFTDTTNQFGLVNLEIGNGIPTIGTFDGIDWSTNSKFIETSIDPAGGSSYVSIGTSQLLSVPYSLYSSSTGDSTRWKKNNDDLYYMDGNVGIGVSDPDAKIEVNGQLKITDGNEGADKVLTSDANGLATWEEAMGSIDVGPNYGTVVNPATGKTWLDRNLGASQVATSSTDALAYGDLYQWGRAQEGHEDRTSTIYGSQASSWLADEGSNLWDGKFIIGSNDWLSTAKDDLWSGTAAENNPCPSGFRLPTNAELNQERLSWSSNDAAGAYGSPLKLVSGGYRDGNDGLLYGEGSNGYYWSSSGSGNTARLLYFYTSNASMSTYTRASGQSVRCIKD